MKTSINLVDATNPGTLADELGLARARLQAAKKEVQAIEALLKSTGVVNAEGDLFHVAISYDVESNRIDWKKLAESYKPSEHKKAYYTKKVYADKVRVSATKKVK